MAEQQEQQNEQKNNEQETVDTLVAKMEEQRQSMQAQIDKLTETLNERNETIKRILNQQPASGDVDDDITDKIIKKLHYIKGEK